MKKALIASTILATLGGAAYAETGVSISGYGRFGLSYYSGRDAEGPGYSQNKTIIHTRLRLNIDAKTESDVGVTFGGRIRMQYQNGNTQANLSPALLYASYEGLRLEVGNVNTALDSSALFYDSELGLFDSSWGDSLTDTMFDDYGYFRTGSYGSGDQMGISASYSIDGFTGMLSYIDFSQSVDYDAEEKEYSLALAYTAGDFTVAAAGTWNGNGIDGNDVAFIGGAYSFSDAGTVGLNYIKEGTANGGAVDLDDTIVLYGNYTMDALTLKAYVSYNDTDEVALGDDNLETNTAFGIGADYDLGGAKLTGSIQYDYWKETAADIGVRFDF